jgi:methylglutaconyl-CoA hydratase
MSDSDGESDSLLLHVTPKGVATVTLNRPDVHNAFNEELIQRLADVFTDLGDQDGVRVVIVDAKGKSFSAGADLKWMERASRWSAEQNKEDSAVLGGMLRALNTLPKPTIALVQGSAYGGGVGLVAACDVAIGVRAAQFSLSEVRLGLLPAVISPYVVRAITARQARRYFLTGERFDADEAMRIGLLHRVVDDEAALGEAGNAFVKLFLAAAPGAIAASKDLIFSVSDQPVDGAMVADTARRIAERRQSDEGREGIAAFLAKRKPKWAE